MLEDSTADLICLHLEAYADARDQSPAPAEITATGIGDILEVDDTAASRVQLLNELSALEDEGLVTAEERPVEGRIEPRTVYLITDTGQGHAIDLREMVAQESVILTNGIEQEVRLDEIGQYLDAEAPLLTALARLTEDGEVPLEDRGGPSFVDRETPLETFVDAIGTAFEADCQTITVAGTSGMGKTALVREAIDRIEADVADLVTARGSCPAGTSNPYDPFRQAFESIPDEGDLLERLIEAKTSFTPEEPEELEAQRIAFFNDIADGLRDVAAEQPVVLFLDNLQWADDSTLDLFEHLATSISDWLTRVAFVGTYRPDTVAGGDHPLPGTLKRIDTDAAYTDITLTPLGRGDTRQLLAGIIGGQDLPEGFVDLVHDRTGGNPLFVRETATHLLESNLVDASRDVYPTSPDDVTLPQEVTEQIDERIMSLDDNSRELLRLGAVAGERVPARVLAEASDIPAARRREYEDVLIASHIWEQTGPGPDTAPAADSDAKVIADGGRDFRFISGGLREAVVDRLPETLAPRYHAQIAEAFESVFEGSLDDHASQIGHHYERAERYEPAIDCFRRAGAYARTSYAHDEAVTNLERAIDLGREHDVLEASELAEQAIELAEVHQLTGDYEAAFHAIDDGLQFASDESREHGRLLGVKARTESRGGRYDQARETAQRQRELAADLGAEDLEADALYQLGTAAWRQADYETAREHLDAARSRFEAVEDDAGLAKTEKALGNVAAMRRKNDPAREHYEAARERYEAIDDRHGLASIHNNISILEHRAGNQKAAREQLETALEGYRQVGDRNGAATAHINLATRLREVGEMDQARDHFEAALGNYERVDDRHGMAQAQYQLGKFEEFQGNFEAAEERFERALEGFQAVDNQADVANVYFAYGNLARKQGRYGEATDHYETAQGRFEEIGDRREVGRCHLQLGWVARLEGEYGFARERLEDGKAILEELESELGVAWANLHLGEFNREFGEYDAASEHFDRAARGIEDHGETHGIARLRLARAELAFETGDNATARELATDALERFESVSDPLWANRARRALGRVAAETDSPGTARDHWTAALETFEAVGVDPDILAILQELVELSHSQGDEEAASDWLARAAGVLDRASGAAAERHRAWIETEQPASD